MGPAGTRELSLSIGAVSVGGSGVPMDDKADVQWAYTARKTIMGGCVRRGAEERGVAHRWKIHLVPYVSQYGAYSEEKAV